MDPRRIPQGGLEIPAKIIFEKSNERIIEQIQEYNKKH